MTWIKACSSEHGKHWTRLYILKNETLEFDRFQSGRDRGIKDDSDFGLKTINISDSDLFSHIRITVGGLGLKKYKMLFYTH